MGDVTFYYLIKHNISKRTFVRYCISFWRHQKLAIKNSYFTASAPPIGAIPAALVASLLLEWIGRKNTLLLSMTISLFTFVILGTGSLHESLTAIIIARSLTGIAVGFSMPAAQIYVSLIISHWDIH